MNEDQLSVAYASSDVFLFPSSVETFGLVTLEAAASGLPVVVEEGCSGHLVKNGESGYACPEADEDAFFRATFELVTNHEKRQRFSQSSRQLSLQWEKQAIVRRMLDNYATVTEEFYTLYGGRHLNRDSLYRNRSGSFKAGSHPRPLLLILVEWVFITLFNSMFAFSTVFMYVQRSVLSRMDGDCAPSSDEKKEKFLSRRVAPSPSGTVVIVKDNGLVYGKSVETGDGTDLFGVSFMESYESDDDAALMADEGQMATDDSSGRTESSATSTTTSQDATVSSAGTSFNQECGNAAAASLEVEPPLSRRVSHGMAKLFVQSVEFQCRIESDIRNFFCGRAMRTKYTKSGKRKNSSHCWEAASLPSTT